MGNGPTRACTGRPLDTLDLICRVVRLIGGQIGLRYQVCISSVQGGSRRRKTPRTGLVLSSWSSLGVSASRPVWRQAIASLIQI